MSSMFNTGLINQTLAKQLTQPKSKNTQQQPSQQNLQTQQELMTHYNNLITPFQSPIFQNTNYAKTLAQSSQNPLAMLNTYSLNPYMPQGLPVQQPNLIPQYFNQSVNTLMGQQPQFYQENLKTLRNITKAEELYSNSILFISITTELLKIVELNFNTNLLGKTEAETSIQNPIAKLRQKLFQKSNKNTTQNTNKYTNDYLVNLKQLLQSLILQFQTEIVQYANYLTLFNQTFQQQSNPNIPHGLQMMGGYQMPSPQETLYYATRQIFELFRVLFTTIYSTLINDIMKLQQTLMSSQSSSQTLSIINKNMSELPKVIEKITSLLDTRLETLGLLMETSSQSINDE